MADSVIEMRPSKVSTAKIGARKVLSPKGSLTFENCKDLEAMFQECMSENRMEVILDFKAVSLLDSEALELLLRMNDELKGRGGVLKIIAVNEVCRDILAATRLVHLFHLYEDLHGAIVSR